MPKVVHLVCVTIAAALLALAIGAYAGSALGYAIAFISDRDPAELKDMLIWSSLGTALTFGAGMIWLCAVGVHAPRALKLAAAILFAVVSLASVGITTLAYIEAPRYSRR